MELSRTRFARPAGALALAMMLIVSACGGTTSSPAATGGTGQQVTIRYQDWRLAEEPSATVLSKMVGEFMDANPDIKVALEPVASGEKANKFVTQVRGGNPPDVVKVQTTDIPAFQGMGALLNLDPYIKQLDATDYKSQFTDFLAKAVTVDASWYGIPHEGDAFVLYVNSRLWDAAGLDVANPPTTLADLKVANQQLTDAATDRYAFGMLADPSLVALWMQSWFTASGADFFNADYTDTVIDSPEAITAFTFYTDMYTKDKVVPPGATQVDYAAQITLFAQEKVAYIQGPLATKGNILAANPDLKDVLEAIPFPGTKATAGRGSVYAIAKASKNADAAWRFIQFMTSEQNQLTYFKDATMMPTLKSALAKIDISADPIARTIIQDALPAAKSYPITTYWAKTKPIIDDAVATTLLGESKPDAALTKAAAAIRALMKESQ